MGWRPGIFTDRTDAGHRLASVLEHLRGQPVVVLGLPRGGVPVAEAVAQAIGAPLDVIVVRKLGVPFQPELGMGAIGEGGVEVVNWTIVSAAGVSSDEITRVEARERAELERRALRYRGGAEPAPLGGRVAVVVDDGIATGSTARAACRTARARGAARVVLAVPVAPKGWVDRMGGDADECISVETPESFFAIGEFYRDFSQVSDEDVTACLERAAGSAPTRVPVGDHADDPAPFDADVDIPIGPYRFEGHLTVPEHARGIVVFAHGSGSSRHSPRNRYVAAVLNGAGVGTLLFDLLTSEEELSRTNVFDIELLAARLTAATGWLRAQGVSEPLPVGYFGASTGAGAALWAAAEPAADVAAIVSRGGRPDLAAPRLGSVRAPTLLVVGGRDDVVLELNRRAKSEMRCDTNLAVVPGATHLFEEPGTLQRAAELARDWFVDRFGAERRRGGADGPGATEPRR